MYIVRNFSLESVDVEIIVVNDVLFSKVIE